MYGRGYQSGGFGFGPAFTPRVIKQLLIANAVVFLLQRVDPIVNTLFVVSPVDVWQHGFLWQPFTYMWLHGGIWHIAGNMFVLWMFGSPLAALWGPRRFLSLYFFSGVGAGFVIASLPYLTWALGLTSAVSLMIPTLGASGAIFGILVGFVMTWPDRQIMLIFPPVVFRAIWLIPIFFVAIYFLGPHNVSDVAHVSGCVLGWLWMSRMEGRRLLPRLEQVRWHWRRFRMRRRLRAVQNEQARWRDRFDDDKRRYH